MVKANELRQGNYVMFDGKIIPVLNITQDTPDCEGVPLTPEILEKVGFEKGCPYSKHNGYTAPNEAFFFENDYYPNEITSGRSIGKEIEYLHQLQNLYFALTGEELTVNFKELTYL